MKKHLIGLFVIVSALLMLMSTAFAASDYTITDIRLTDLSGNSINYTSGSCMVNVSVTKNNDVTDGYVVISSYTEDGTFIGFNYLYTNLDAGESATLGAMVVPPEDNPIALVKATVWNSLSSMTPLAVSKTLVPGEEPEEVDVIVDGTLINSQDDTKQGVTIVNEATQDGVTTVDATLYIKATESTAAKNANAYTLKNAVLYVNGFEYCNINTDNAYAVQSLIAASEGNTVLVQATGEADGVYNKVMVDVYALAMVTQVKVTSGETAIKLTSPVLPAGVSNPGSTIAVTSDQLNSGSKTITVTRNGAASSLDDLQAHDIVAIKYDISKIFDTATNIEIIATNNTATGEFTGYDTDTNTYTVGGTDYKTSNAIAMTFGMSYTLYLDPFGDIFAVDVVETPINYAIVEAYTTTAGGSTEYDYIDVVTFDGQSKRLYVDENKADAISAELLVMLGADSYADRATATTSIDDRLISYTIKASTGRVDSVTTLVAYEDYLVLSDAEYKSATNRLGTATLSDSVVVLDATMYEPGYSSTYKASSVSSILEDTLYNAIVVHRSSIDRTWTYVIVTMAGSIYSSSSDWAVVSAKNFSTSSVTIIDDEEYAVLKVAGADTPLYVSFDAKVYVSGTAQGYELGGGDHLLREGTVFFYTVNADGFVDRIDIVASVSDMCCVNEETYSEWNDRITLPGLSNLFDGVRNSDWQVGMTYSGTPMFSSIQVFFAPVVTASDRNVSFAELESAGDGVMKFNANATYDFAIADDANIIAYDWSSKGSGANAFSDGAFYGITLSNTDANGYAYVGLDGTSVPDYTYDFAGEVCYALVMAVDEVITNAVIYDCVY